MATNQWSTQAVPRRLNINIEGSVEGDLEITGEVVEVTIGGDVTGNITIKQMGLEQVQVTVDGESITSSKDSGVSEE